MSYLLCKHCEEHRVSHAWWRVRHNPVNGFKNYTHLMRDLTLPVAEASVSGSSTPDMLTGGLVQSDRAIVPIEWKDEYYEDRTVWLHLLRIAEFDLRSEARGPKQGAEPFSVARRR